MQYYEPYLAHWRPKGAKNGFHLFGEQRPAKYYKLGEKTIGFIKNIGNGMYAAKTGLKSYGQYLEAQREANKLMQEAERHKAQASVYWPDGIEKQAGLFDFKGFNQRGKAVKEMNEYTRLKNKADDILAKAEKKRKKSEKLFATARKVTPGLSTVYIKAAKAIYGAVDRLKRFINDYGYKRSMNKINKHNESEKFKAMIDPSYKPKYKKYY